ncbi:MAG: RpiB/LacA/LacB family sugar-phosphate isomerase [Ruminococcus sp.]|nr:RpiB/LacA/LacB family sugar-phosphate isomerase [Ruminococcus sp.]
MKIGVIQASSQAEKNELIFSAVSKFAPKGSQIFNFGCTADEQQKYSYIEVSVLVGLLLASGSVDFVVTGCSSGQGMMLACNNMPGVLCGYAPTPKDAYLFAQINNGNAISLPLGEDYTFSGAQNLENTVKELFSEPFGQGWPKSEADRKLKDTQLLKSIREKSQVSMTEFFGQLGDSITQKILQKRDVIEYIVKHGKKDIADLIKGRMI